MDKLRFRILGPLEVTCGVEPIELGSPKQQTVLAVLLASPNRVVSTDRLVTEIWGENPPDQAVNSLQTYISHIRGLLGEHPSGGEWIETQRPGYQICVQPGQLDALQFADAVDGGTVLVSTQPAEAAQILREALGLWRGEAFVGVADHFPMLQAEAIRLNELRFTALELAIEADLAIGNHGSVIGELEMLTAEHPLREHFWVWLMTALYRSGRQSEALRAFQAARRSLGELGIEPSPELRELEDRILLQDPNLVWSGQDARPKHNLPAQISSFVGRLKERSEVTKLIHESRLVTVTGPGGSGKTRLALEAAGDVDQEFPEGVWFVPLAPLGDGSLIATELVGIVGLSPPLNRAHLDALCDFLADRATLLVVDNCEHLLEEAAKFVVTVLSAAPALKVLTTSREPLGIAGEVVWPLQPMELPGTGETVVGEIVKSEAVRLFAERATAARPAFGIDGTNAETVADICRRLDGLPLAIELAAARSSSLSVYDIHLHLDDRFRLLKGGGTTAPPRQQTLLAAVEWSYELLDDRHRELYRRLAVFPAGFTLHGAEVVGAMAGIAEEDVLDLLTHLVAQSLVNAEEAQVSVRYRMLESIRAHGLELLEQAGESDSARTALLNWTTELAAEASREIQGPEQLAWIARLEIEHDNIRAALRWALDVDPLAGLEVITSMAGFWWLHPLSPAPGGTARARPYLQEGAAWFQRMMDAAGETVPTSLRARALLRVGGLLDLRLGRVQEAEEHLKEAESLARQLNDPQIEAGANFYRAWATWDSVPLAETASLCLRAAQLYGSAEDPAGVAQAKLFQGYALLLAETEKEEAAHLIRQFDDWARSTGAPSAVAHANDFSAVVAMLDRSAEDIAGLVEEALRLFCEIGAQPCVSHVLQTAAMHAAGTGKPEHAALLMGAADDIHERTAKVAMVMPACRDRATWVEELGAGFMDSDASRAAFEAGRALGFDKSVAVALEGLRE